MRKLIAILCLCLSFVMMDNAAVAQGNGEPATLMPNTPLIVVDRTYLADDFSAIKPSDIIKVDTLNGAKAAALFGARGANGVFLVTTKKGKPGTKYAEQLSPYLSKVKYRSWVALNSKLADSGLAGLNTSDIIKLEFSKKGVKSGDYLSKGRYPLLSIITKDYAVNAYLNKLCSVTWGYRKYLNDRNFDDSEVLYDVNGEFIRHSDELIKLLYNLPVEKIKDTNLNENYMMKSQNHTVFSITTK